MVFNEEEFLPHDSLDHQIDYKLKYKALKRKLKFLVYEQESFLEELRKSQRKLLKLSRDKSFLLDRLLQYEKTEDTSGDSDMTASSDSDDGHKDTSHSKKRRSGTSPVAGGGGGGGAGGTSQSSEPAGGVIKSEPVSHARASSPDMSNKKRPKAVARKGGKTSTPKPHLGKLTSGGATIQMTREELERHLDSRQPFLGFDKAPALLPSEIFNNDNSNQWSGSGAGGDEDDADLVIDMVQ